MHAGDVVQVTKKAVRVQINSLLRSLEPHVIESESNLVHRHVRSSEWYTNSHHVGVYISFGRELDTRALIHDLLDRRLRNNGTRVFIPYMSDVSCSEMTFLELHSRQDLADNFAMNQWGILEPKSESIAHRADVFRDSIPLHLMLMPGLGFDRACHRLGRGKGYYDRFLSRLISRLHQHPRPLLVGLSLSCQLLDEIPVTATDHALDHVVTAENVFSYSKQLT
jgi:5-formyltetrahydrofolate cyclo-ligase